MEGQPVSEFYEHDGQCDLVESPSTLERCTGKANFRHRETGLDYCDKHFEKHRKHLSGWIKLKDKKAE